MKFSGTVSPSLFLFVTSISESEFSQTKTTVTAGVRLGPSAMQQFEMVPVGRFVLRRQRKLEGIRAS